MSAPKTQGIEFYYHSLAAFNGTGYADMTDIDSFIDSYVAYKRWKKQHDKADYMDVNRASHQEQVANLITGNGAGRKPSDRNLKSFGQIYPPALHW